MVYARNAGAAQVLKPIRWLDIRSQHMSCIIRQNLTMDKASPQTRPVTVKFTATASGGSGSYQYQFRVKDPVTGYGRGAGLGSGNIFTGHLLRGGVIP